MALQGTQEQGRTLASIPTLSPRFFVLLAVCALLYYGAAKLGLLLALAHSNATPVWPPSGLALALFLVLGKRAWPAVMAGAWLANVIAFMDNQAGSGALIAVTAGAMALGNTLEAFIGAQILRSFGDGKTEFRSQLGVYRFCACIASAAIIAATIGTVSLTASGIIAPEAALHIAGTWWIGDFLGMLIITPACMLFAAPARWRPLPVCLLALATLAVSGVVFSDNRLTTDLPRFMPYILLVPVVWAALKYGRVAVILQLIVIAAVAVPLTAAQRGPFASGVQHQSLLSLCAFLIVVAIVGYVICADRLAFDDIESASSDAAEESWAPLALLVGCLALTVSAWSFVSDDTERRASERFDATADAVRARLAEKLSAYESLLRSGAALFEASEQVEKSEWEAFVRGLNLPQNYPGVMGLGYAAHIPAPRAEAMVGAIRADGQPSFHIWPPGPRELYVPITFLEPQSEANAAALGFDMHVEAVRARAIDEAALSGRLSASGPVRLVQQSASERYAGFLMFIPIFENNERRPGSSAQPVRGFVYCPLRMIDLVNGIFGTGLDETRLEIFDGVIDGPLMFASGAAHGNRSYLTHLNSIQRVQIGDVGHQWVLRISPTSLFDASIDQGKPFIVLVLGTMISLLFFGISRNLVEARKHALVTVNQSSARLKEKSDILAESEARFKLLTSAIRNHAILKLDPGGSIASWNAGAKRLFGYDAEDIVGRDVGILATPPDGASAPSGQAAMLAALEQGQFEETQVRYRRDGSSFLALAELFPIISEAGQEMGFAMIIRDVTEEKAAEQELFDAKVRAEAASEAKSAFVANMSHELRTPMNAVLGIAQLLAHTELTRDQQNYLQMISVAGRSLLAVINDVLDFSKIEANKLDIVIEPFALDDIVDSVAAVMAVNAADKPVTVSICVAADVPHGLIGDAQRIGQILVNLVSNAIKFTERGSVALNIGCTRGDAGVCDLQFCVVDTGIGMNEQDVATLFTPFSQADASMARRFGGTGLGLAISQRFAALMGGQIRVDSVAGAGSSFTFALRLKVDGAMPDPYALPAEFFGLHLLYADEDTTLHRCALELAKRWGWSIDVVTSTAMLAARLADYARSGQRCDVILAGTRLAGAFPAGATGAVRARVTAGQPARICLADAYVVGARAQLRPDNVDAVVNRPLTRSALYRAMSAHGASGRADVLLPQNKPLAGISVLLAEDNPLNQVVACGMLEMAGASVHIVANGSEAVAMLRHNQASFDLVLMDVQMPVMDGFCATEAIRRDLGLSLPVLAMSAGVTMVEQARCQQSGMNDFIPKPVEADVLVATILRYGRRQRASVDGVFDVARLEAMAQQDAAKRAQLVGLVRKAIVYGAETADQIRAAVAASEAGAAADGLHSLRGTLGTLGANRFVRASAEAERLLRGGQAGPDEVRATLDLVWVEQAHTVDLAKAWLRVQDDIAVDADINRGQT